MIKFYNYNNTKFIKSALYINNYPMDLGIEIAFVGYTNSGKSSFINILTNQKKLAKISKNPGCTKLINFFEIESNIRLVDLPGYGYSNISKNFQYKCKDILLNYLKKRKSLKILIILMDIRYPMKKLDFNIIKLSKKLKKKIFIILTKADKLNINYRLIQIKKVKYLLKNIYKNESIDIFLSKKNLNNIKKKINYMINLIK